ncbi:MAG: sigma-70 family RNA polymerase sigma factor [Candidatus Omnitrophica bacterium]|nr:sigma-70 family RNA polymerase sigma factor [Candidatus Omnitrophota bacterium]
MREIAKEIIELAAGGDISAFEEIYKAFSSTVYTVALGVTRDSRDAEEVTQDVFLKAFRGLKRFKFGSSLGTWIYRITVNTAINVYRSGARRRAFGMVDYDEIKDSVPDLRNTSKEEIEKRHAAESVDRILKDLSFEHRSCIVLREIEGLDYKEMAQVLGIPINTVRSRLKRARAAMVTCAKREGLNHGL